MNNKQYIYVLEESPNDDSITPKWKNMKFLDNLILRVFTPVLKDALNKMNESNSRAFDDLRLENAQLRDEIKKLSKGLNELSERFSKNDEKTNILFAEFNTKKASADSKYKNAIDYLYRLNRTFEDSVGAFGRAKKLEILEMLVQYLYNPEKAIQERIQLASMDDERSLSILAEIGKFNDEYRPDLGEYLASINAKWNDCVQYPIETNYNPRTMACYNDLEIEIGTPIYVVSLGFNFPNSNSEKQLPKVFKRTN